MKAKEYDKVDILKSMAEAEAKMNHIQLDNENLVKERNNLDLANVELNRYKGDLEHRLIQMESELEFFKKQQDDHLDQFDVKMEMIQSEMEKLKYENTQLKERERNHKRMLKENTEES